MLRLSPRAMRALVAVVVLAGGAAHAGAAVVYTATTPRYYLPADADPLYYNVGPDSGAGRILFDDVPILLGVEPAPSINVTQVSFDISRRPNAPATTINAWWAPLVLDNAQFGGAGDGPNDDPSSPLLIGSVNLPQNGPAHSRSTISFGDGVSLLFNTGTLNLAQAPGWGMFALGLEFSDISADQGWTIGVHPDNSDLLWDYASNITYDEFTYGLDGNGQFIIGTQLMTVTGSVVPEPAAASILGALLAGVAARRSHRTQR